MNDILQNSSMSLQDGLNGFLKTAGPKDFLGRVQPPILHMLPWYSNPKWDTWDTWMSVARTRSSSSSSSSSEVGVGLAVAVTHTMVDYHNRFKIKNVGRPRHAVLQESKDAFFWLHNWLNISEFPFKPVPPVKLHFFTSFYDNLYHNLGAYFLGAYFFKTRY